MSKKLHIVSFDVPFPADYGGAIDVFYRIKALSKLGVEITLHCFEYGRGEQDELNKYCTKVYYYSRKKSLKALLSKDPFIVQTRRSKKLLDNLLQDDIPILFEGLHTTAFINHPLLKGRVKLVRTHNIEHTYYRELANQASGVKKLFFALESRKLENYETHLTSSTAIFAIKDSDRSHFSQFCSLVYTLPACTEEIKVRGSSETLPYVLFHGNLSVPENSRAVIWLIENVFDDKPIKFEFKVAGKNPDKSLVIRCKTIGVDLFGNPSSEKMTELLQKARIHVFFSNQNTGVKLKLIQSLMYNSHIIANENMVDDLLRPYVHIATCGNDYKKELTNLLASELSQEEKNARALLLETKLNALKNCEQIIAFL